MANDWQVTTLDTIGKIVTGKTPPTSKQEYYGDEIPFITPSDMDARRIIDSTKRYLTAAGAKVVSSSIIPPKSVIVSCIGSDMGKVAICLRKSVTNQQINSIIVNDEHDPYFLYYNLLLRKSEIKGSAAGSAQPILNKTAFGKLPIVLPSLKEQKAIARILGTFDDKIELNRQMNETLEAIARALFRSWFIDFDPVRAKAKGRAPYLAHDIWNLFPERLNESELPEGWNAVPVNNLIEFNPTESLRKGELAPYLDMASLPTQGSCPNQYVMRPFGSGMKFRNGDTLLARITPCLENGKTAFVECLPKGVVGWGSTEYIVMRPKSSVPPPFAYLLARDQTFREHAIRSMTGTSGRQRAQGDSVAAFKIVVPTDEKLWKGFARIVLPLFSGIKANSEMSASLSCLRDTLLPKLISGELPVKDVERIIGDAT